MKGSSFYGKKVKCTPLQQQNKIAGEATGKVSKNKKGEEYAIFGDGDEGMSKYYAGNVGVNPGDTIFSGPQNIQSVGDDEKYIMGGDYNVEETESSKKRNKKMPKSYKITGDAK